MSDSWQTIPVKHRKWASISGSVPSPAPASGSAPGSSFSTASKDKEQRPSFSSFGSRKTRDETNNRTMPSAFADKRGGSDSRREQEEQRRQWQARLELDRQRALDEEEKTLRDALTIESEKEYPSLQNASPISSGSPKKSSNNLLNFKAMIEAPASPNVPKITVIGGAKPATPQSTPHSKHDYEREDMYYEEEEEEFNAHIGDRRRGGDAW